MHQDNRIRNPHDEEKAIRLIVPGEPQGKKSPLFSRRHAYMSEKTVHYDIYIKEIFAITYPDFTPLEGPLRMTITAWMMIPKSTSLKKTRLMIEREIRPTKRPDCDNIAKSVGDALEKLAYKNDSQFVTVVIHKFYATNPRLEIEITGAQI